MKVTEIKQNFPSAKIYMINSDCIYFSISKSENLSNVDLNSNVCGEFKCDIKDAKGILSFQALNPHSLNIVYECTSGDYKNRAKICGFQLQNRMNEKGIDQDLFEKLISEALQDNKVCKPLK